MSIGKDPIRAFGRNNVLQEFSDAIAGRSMQLYHAVAATDSAGVDYVLTRDSGTSRPTLTAAQPTFGVNGHDFDITINKPTIFAGIATIDITFGQTGGGAGAAKDFNVYFKIYHYDGTTETEIGTVDTETQSLTTDGSIRTKMNCTITRKLFKIGDILRLNMKGTTDSGVGTRKITVWHDPNTADSELFFWMPVQNME